MTLRASIVEALSVLQSTRDVLTLLTTWAPYVNLNITPVTDNAITGFATNRHLYSGTSPCDLTHLDLQT